MNMYVYESSIPSLSAKLRPVLVCKDFFFFINLLQIEKNKDYTYFPEITLNLKNRFLFLDFKNKAFKIMFLPKTFEMFTCL